MGTAAIIIAIFLFIMYGCWFIRSHQEAKKEEAKKEEAKKELFRAECQLIDSDVEAGMFVDFYDDDDVVTPMDNAD